MRGGWILSYSILALWKGTSPSVLRSLVMGTIQLSVYDELKTKLRARDWHDDFKLFGLCGFVAGLACVVVGSPLDVIRSRRMVVREGDLSMAGDSRFLSCLKTCTRKKECLASTVAL